MPTRTLTPTDVNRFLGRLSDAIERDQIYVDGLPRERFSLQYDDQLWRDWRRDHGTCIGKLLRTTCLMSPAVLKRLTEVAVAHEPEAVGRVLLEQFAEIVSGSVVDDFGTAELFFGWLVERMGRPTGRRSRRTDARTAMALWMSSVDPLRISRDPECGYPRADAA